MPIIRDVSLVITVILFLCVALRRLPWALALFVALLPVYQIRFSLGLFPTTLLEVLFWILLLVWFVRRRSHVFLLLQQFPMRWPLLLLLLAAGMAVLAAPDRYHALGLYRAYFAEPILFLLIAWDVLRTEERVRAVLFALGLCATAVGVTAVLQYLGFVFSPEPWIAEMPKRVVGLFAYPNAVGLFLAPVLGIFASVLLVPPAPASGRQFFWGVAVVGLLGVTLSVSRGALLGLGAGILFLAWWSPHRRWLYSAAAILVVVLLLTPGTRAQLARIVTVQDVSTDVRTVLWQGTARLLADHPIFGAGLGGFPQLYDQYRLRKHTELLLYPHNILLNAWVELGALGALAFTWIYLAAFRLGARLLRMPLSALQRQLVLGVLAALLITVVHGLVDVPYFKNDLAMQFWLFFGMLFWIARAVGTGQKV